MKFKDCKTIVKFLKFWKEIPVKSCNKQTNISSSYSNFLSGRTHYIRYLFIIRLFAKAKVSDRYLATRKTFISERKLPQKFELNFVTNC